MTDSVSQAFADFEKAFEEFKAANWNGNHSAKPPTPTAFNWTPEMQAIWPAEMRPTMSGLLAIWEAMQGSAVYGEEVEEDGWIKWMPFHEIPSEKNTVTVKLRDGYQSTGKPSEFRMPKNETNWWSWQAVNQIIAYRVVK